MAKGKSFKLQWGAREGFLQLSHNVSGAESFWLGPAHGAQKISAPKRGWPGPGAMRKQQRYAPRPCCAAAPAPPLSRSTKPIYSTSFLLNPARLPDMIRVALARALGVGRCWSFLLCCMIIPCLRGKKKWKCECRCLILSLLLYTSYCTPHLSHTPDSDSDLDSE